MSAKAIMPGLKACSAEFRPLKPFNCIKISVSYQKATEEAAITKTLTEFGATVQSCSCSCNILSTQDHTAVAAASDSASIFDQKCWKCIKRGLDWGDGGGPDLIIDDSGNAMFFIHAGLRAEEIYAQKGGLPLLSSDYDDDEILIHFARTGKFDFFSIFVEGLETDSKRYHNLKEGLVGVSVGTATGFKRQQLMRDCRFFSFPVFDISDFVTKSKYCEMFGSRSAILGGIKKGTNMTISEKTALVCGYGDTTSKGCAMALKQAGAIVVVAEADPNLATQARLRGFSVMNKAPDNVVSEADILVANFNMDNIDVLSNVKNMKNKAVIYNTGSSTDVALFEPYFPGMKQIILDCHTEKWVSSDGNKCVIVVSNPGYPNLMPSWSATSHVVAMLEFMSQKKTGKYVGKVYAFPKHLDEKVSDLHLGKLKAAAAAKKETEGQAADPFTTTTADAMSMRKMLNMLIQVVPIIGVLAYALSKVSKDELTFSAFWGGGN